MGIGSDVFAKGDWYHETLEDGLAISYRVRPHAGAPPRAAFFWISTASSQRLAAGRRRRCGKKNQKNKKELDAGLGLRCPEWPLTHVWRRLPDEGLA